MGDIYKMGQRLVSTVKKIVQTRLFVLVCVNLFPIARSNSHDILFKFCTILINYPCKKYFARIIAFN